MINIKNPPKRAKLRKNDKNFFGGYRNVTIGKVYKIYTDFEIQNTLFFDDDLGFKNKVIPSWFEKI